MRESSAAKTVVRRMISISVLGALALELPVGCWTPAGVDPNSDLCAPYDDSVTNPTLQLRIVGQGTVSFVTKNGISSVETRCATECTISRTDMPPSYMQTDSYCGWMLEALPAAGWRLSRWELAPPAPTDMGGTSPHLRLSVSHFKDGSFVVTAIFVESSTPDAGADAVLDAMSPDSDTGVVDGPSEDVPAPEVSVVDSGPDTSIVDSTPEASMYADSGSDSLDTAADAFRLDLVYCRCVGATGFATACLEVPGCTSGMPAPAGACDSICSSGTVASSCEPESSLCL